MWLVRLLIGVARPIARGRKRRRVGPSSTVIEATRISSAGILEGMKAARPGQREREVAAVADYRLGGAAGRELQQRPGLLDVHAAHLVGDQPRLARGDPHVAGAGFDDGWGHRRFR